MDAAVYLRVLMVSSFLFAACAGGGKGGDPDAAGGGADADTTTDASADADAGVFDATDFDAVPNMPPTISAIADQTTVTTPVGPVAFTVGDAETAVASLVVTAVSSDQAVIPDANLVLGGTDANRSITLTPIASGTATITVTVDDGTDTASEPFDLAVTNQGPIGVTDDYNWFGNTELTVPAGTGVLFNDTDGDADALTAVAIVAGATTMGGTVELATDGSFVYRPPVGVTLVTDSFTYVVTDGFETGSGTANIALTELIWYVDNTAAAGGDGRSHAPFDTLAEAEAASASTDIIFVYEGDGTTAGQNAGISLKDGQQLIGNGIALVVNAVTLVAAAGNPVITNTAGAGVNLNGDTVVRGLTIDSPTLDGINGNAITGARIEDVTITSTGGQAIDIGNPSTTTLVDVRIRNNTLTGNGADFTTTTTGVDLVFGGTGRLEALVRDNTITGVTVGIFVSLLDTTGSGAGSAPNLVTVLSNTITDVDDDAIQLEPDDTATSNFLVTDNVIDGRQNIGAATPARGLDFRVRTAPGGVTTSTITGNTVTDTGLEGFNLVSFGSGNGGTLTMLVDNNQISNAGSDGMTVAPDDDVVFHATVTNNTMTGNANPSSFEFFAGTTNVMHLNLATNEDDAGFRFERDAVGVLNLAGTIGVGSSFVDDNGNVNANLNTTGGGAPTVVIAGAGNLINIVDPATIATP